MGTERKNCPACKIVAFKQCGYRHRNGGPPVGIPQDDGVILLPLLLVDLCLKLWPCLLVLVPLCLVKDSAVVIGIGFHKLKLYNIVPSLFLDFSGHTPCVAAPGIIDDESLALSGARTGYSRLLGHNSPGRCFVSVVYQPEPHIVGRA